jgi:hypothetical protein
LKILKLILFYLADGFTTCSRSDPKFHDCLPGAVTQAMMLLKDGASQFGLPKIDPYFIKYIESDTIGGAANFVLKSSIKNTNMLGFGTTQIIKMNTKFGKNNFAIRTESNLNSLQLIGDYMMKGQILVLPIDGEGKCNVTMVNPNVYTQMKGKYFEKDGEKYLNATTFEIDLKPRKAYFNFENLFKNDKKLSDTINHFMNENWQLVIDNLIPGYEKSLGLVFKDEANKIFNNVPFNKIFKD